MSLDELAIGAVSQWIFDDLGEISCSIPVGKAIISFEATAEENKVSIDEIVLDYDTEVFGATGKSDSIFARYEIPADKFQIIAAINPNRVGKYRRQVQQMPQEPFSANLLPAPKRSDSAGQSTLPTVHPIEANMPSAPTEVVLKWISGIVVLGFEIDEKGLARKIQVLSSIPQRLYDVSATKMIRTWKYPTEHAGEKICLKVYFVAVPEPTT